MMVLVAVEIIQDLVVQQQIILAAAAAARDVPNLILVDGDMVVPVVRE